MIMKKTILLSVMAFIFGLAEMNAQGWMDYSSGMEFIFSNANVTGSAMGTNYSGTSDWNSTINEGNRNPVRFTLFLHLQHHIHYNFSKSAGVYTGLTIRNVGFVQNQAAGNGNPEYASVYRTYTMGIPLAFKLGNMEKHFSFYAGAEAGFAFNYKEKHFQGEKRASRKSMTTEWFSGRTNWFQPQLFVGLQLPGGANLKFAYYPSNFFNAGYTESSDGVTYSPYSGVEVNMFYTSVSFQLFASDVSKGGGAAPENRTAYR